jgi:hypothetical protein
MPQAQALVARQADVIGGDCPIKDQSVWERIAQ